jgi:hypothetical protein
VDGPLRRMLGLVAVALVASAAAVGCGGGGEEDLTAGLSPEKILEESRAAASAVEFYHPKLTLSLDLTTAPGAEGLAALVTGPVTITAEGPVRRPISESGPAFSLDTVASLGPLTLEGNITKVEDGVYLTIAGQAYTLDLPPEQAAEVRIPPQPALFVESPTEVGREEINGVETVHLQGTVDTDAVVDYVVGLLRGAPDVLGGGEPPADAEVASIRDQVRAALLESRSDVWIGTRDLLPYRVAATARLEGLDLLPDVTALSLDVLADVSGFGEEAEIVAPENPKPFDLGSMLPGLGL